MKYNAEQVDRLAAEYVLGTLHGAARRRFDRLITDRADVRFTVWRWERFLNGFASGIKARNPSPRIWTNIRSRIEPMQSTRGRHVSRWRGAWLALPAAAAAALLAVTLWSTQTFEHVAVFANENVETMWIVSADLDEHVLKAVARNAPPLPAESSYELWILPNNGPPLSLGLLPAGAQSAESQISAQIVAALRDSGRLAISIEPAGGSPTGQPTGPVVFQATLVAI